jgi:hypothetical protein
MVLETMANVFLHAANMQFNTQANNEYVQLMYVGRDSSVGIATDYKLDGPGIESR